MNLANVPVRWKYQNNATTCFIGGSQEEPLIERTVKVRHNDVKEKQIGRFLAFRKSMSHLAQGNLLTRSQRTQMWNDFKVQVKSPIRVQQATLQLT